MLFWDVLDDEFSQTHCFLPKPINDKLNKSIRRYRISKLYLCKVNKILLSLPPFFLACKKMNFYHSSIWKKRGSSQQWRRGACYDVRDTNRGFRYYLHSIQVHRIIIYVLLRNACLRFATLSPSHSHLFLLTPRLLLFLLMWSLILRVHIQSTLLYISIGCIAFLRR